MSSRTHHNRNPVVKYTGTEGIIYYRLNLSSRWETEGENGGRVGTHVSERRGWVSPETERILSGHTGPDLPFTGGTHRRGLVWRT